MKLLTLKICFSTICLVIFSPLNHAGVTETFNLTMPGVTTKDEHYVCYLWKPPFNSIRYITSYLVVPDSPLVHHILVYKCAGKLDATKLDKKCSRHCAQFIYAWARNAPKLQLPKGVGFEIGAKDSSFILMEVHYRAQVATPDHTSITMETTTEHLPYAAAIDLLLKNKYDFPPNKDRILLNLSCKITQEAEFYPLAFRSHSHTHGKVLTGYIYHNKKFTLLGKGNPRWPQAFWPAQTENLVIKKGDVLVVRGVYSTKNEFRPLKIGFTHNDEMFNYYILYYKNASIPFKSFSCSGDNVPSVSALLPPQANELLPPNKTLDDMASMSHHHKPTAHPPATKKPKVADVFYKQLPVSPVANWPSLDPSKTGELPSVAMDQQGFLYLFHRGSAKWDNETFDSNDQYTLDQSKPIKEATISKLDPHTGKVLKQGGRDFFFIPHSIFIDAGNFIWTTDTALQQVFKFPSNILDGSPTKPLLALGTRFKHGFDTKHFCKPSSVVVSSNGEIFVSDGYCNNRVVVFDKAGTFLRQMKLPAGYDSALPHSISINERHQLLYVADRLQVALVVFKMDGTLVKQVKLPHFDFHFFALHYNPSNDLIFCLNGNQLLDENTRFCQVYVINPHDFSLVASWTIPDSATPLLLPHDITANKEATEVYVTAIGYGKWKSRLFKFQASRQNSFLGVPSFHRRPLATMRSPHSVPKSVVVVVLLCLLLVPFLLIIAGIGYVRSRAKSKSAFKYHPVRAMPARKADPAVGKQDELKKLNDDTEDEDDAFDASLFSGRTNQRA